MSHVSYSIAMGNIIYDIMCIGLDILEAASIVSRYMNRHGKAH